MSWWKVVAVVALLAFPAAYALGQLTASPGDPAPRPGIVLSTPTPDGSPSASGSRPPRGTPKPSRTPRPSPAAPTGSVHDCDDEDDDDEDGVIVVHPCPEDLGNDDGDDDGGGDGDDDG